MHKVSNYWRQFPKLHKVYIVSLLLLLGVFFTFPFESNQSNANTNVNANTNTDVNISTDKSYSKVDSTSENITSIQLKPGVIHTIEAPQAAHTEPHILSEADLSDKNVVNIMGESAEISADTVVQYEWRNVKILKNDSLANIFARHKISAKTLLEVSKSGDAAKLLIKKLRPGKYIQLGFLDGEFKKLNYDLSKIHSIAIIANDNNKFESREQYKTVESTNKVAAAHIQSNFWSAGLQAGLNDTQIMNLANIFGWDVDFALDIRKGDSFSAVYEKLYAEGEHVGYGDILAAEFTNAGDTFIAIRHSDGEYYTPEGRSMRKAFLRAPVNFKYISSSFNPRRLHPVTGLVRPHRGIDYAARTGTPVVSAGDGKVTQSGYSPLNGNYIFIQHGKKYETKYLHLNKRYVKKGAKVKQNQKIGTVGATGRVTGAHLHYEFLVNGVHRNPKTVKLPKSDNIDPKALAEFTQTAKQMVDTLHTNKRVLLAANFPETN